LVPDRELYRIHRAEQGPLHFSTTDELGADYEACYEEATDRHDEENDWLTARESQLYNSGFGE